MLESLFVAAALGVGGPPAPPTVVPARPAAGLSADTESAFADTHVQVALASPAPANKDQLLEFARARYLRALHLNPTHKAALLGVARMHSLLGDRERASASFGRYLAAHPTDAAGHHEAALSCARYGDWPAAAELCMTAARLSPTNRQYSTTLGFCLARAGRWDEAQAALARVMPADDARESLTLVRDHVAQLARHAAVPQLGGTAVRFTPVPVEPLAVAPAPREVPVVTASYHLRNVAAGDAYDTFRRTLKETGEEATVGVRTAENQLVVEGSAATHARVVALFGEIDRPAPQVHVSMQVAQVPVAFLSDCGFIKTGDAPAGCYSLGKRERELFNLALRLYPEVGVLSRPAMLLRENQTGYVQIGQNVPADTPPAASPRPAGAAPVDCVMGVSARITPRVMPDGKVLLRFEPQVATATPTVVQTGAGTAFPINIQTVQTTVRVTDGETVVLVGPTTTGGDGKPAALLFVLTPNVVRTAADHAAVLMQEALPVGMRP